MITEGVGGVNLQRFIVILVMVVVMGLVLVYQHARIMHAGFEMAQLTQQREDLNEKQRKMAEDLVELKRPEAVATKAKEFGVDLVPMDMAKDFKVVKPRKPAAVAVKKQQSKRKR